MHNFEKELYTIFDSRQNFVKKEKAKLLSIFINRLELNKTLIFSSLYSLQLNRIFNTPLNSDVTFFVLDSQISKETCRKE